LLPAAFFHRQGQWNYTCCIYWMSPYFLHSLSCNFKFTRKFKIYNKKKFILNGLIIMVTCQ
jgi:hypothetical protein